MEEEGEEVVVEGEGERGVGRNGGGVDGGGGGRRGRRRWSGRVSL